MLSPTDRKLLAALLRRQKETGAAAELPPERVAEIATGSAPSADEAAALLASPLAREELVLHRRLRRLRRDTPPRREPANSNPFIPDRAVAGPLMRGWLPPSGKPGRSPAKPETDHGGGPHSNAPVEPSLSPVNKAGGDNLLFPQSTAPTREGEKTDRDQEPLQLDGPWASLRVEPGPSDDAPYLLTLRLRPEVPGGVANRALEVREFHPDGFVWLTGRTDTTGTIHAIWGYAGLRPQDRPFTLGLRIDDTEAGRF